MAIPQSVSNLLSLDSLCDLRKRFLDQFESKGTQTRETYDHALREFLRWYEQDGMCLFVVDDVLRYRDYLSTQRKLAPASVNTYMNALRQFCEFLHFHGTIGYNPARFVRLFNTAPSRRTEFFTDDEVDRLISVVDRQAGRGKRDLAILMLMVQYGISEHELVRANVRDYIWIEGRGVLKTDWQGDERVSVKLDARLAHLMNDYLATRTDRRKDDALFLSDGNRVRGGRMTVRGIRERVHHYLSKAGIPRGVTPKALKYTAALFLARTGASADEIKHRMRMKSLARALRVVDQQRVSFASNPAPTTARHY